MGNLYLPDNYKSGLEVQPPQAIVPYVIENTNRGERQYDVFSRLLRERIIFLGTGIDDQIANVVIAQLLFLAYEDPEKDIYMYINSPGGEVNAGLAIYDTMQFIQPDVATICMGMAASMATILLCAGTKGKRYSLPNATIHQHPALGGARGSAPDVEITIRYLLELNKRGRDIMAKHTGQTSEKIEQDFMRDRFMTPIEAKEYGFIDEVMQKAEIGKTSPPQ